MQKKKSRFRRPTPGEQTVLREITVKLLVTPKDIRQCDQVLVEHHYLHSARLMGEQLRYAVIWKGQWLAVAAWSAQRFAHRDGGLQRLQALIFAEAPGSWHLPV